MAKRKGAVALFEVIHKDKRFAKPNPTVLSTPAWWFKGREKTATPPPAAPEAPAAPLNQTKDDSWPSSPAAPEMLEQMASAPRPHHHDDRSPVTWTSGLIIGATFIAVIALGMILTRHPRVATAEQPSSDVLNITPQAGEGAPTLVRVPESDNPPAAEQPVVRQRNLYYALIQWYPDETTAREASELLTHWGIGNTLEGNLESAHLPHGGVAVVGTEGFSRTRSSACLAYLAKIKLVSAKFAPPKTFRAFKPFMIVWTKSDGQKKSDSSPPLPIP